jgi:hypothetical protein
MDAESAIWQIASSRRHRGCDHDRA